MKNLRLIFLAAIGLLPFVAGAQLTTGTLPTPSLTEPYGITQDDGYNTYFTDSGNSAIYRIDANSGVISLLAGFNGSGYEDGPAYFAAFSNPQGIFATSIGITMGVVVADTANGRIRFVSTNGTTITLAGNGNGPLFDSAIGTNATFRYPYGITGDTNGNIYVADWGNNAIRVLNINDTNFAVSTLSVTNMPFSLYKPQGLTFVSPNQLWVADTGNNSIRLVTLSNPTNGSQTAYMGNLSRQISPKKDSLVGTNALFNQPGAVMWDPTLGLLISDTGNSTIRLATTNAIYGTNNYSVYTFAGTGQPGEANGAALSSTFNKPFGIIKDYPNGRYLVCDSANHALRIMQYGPVLGPCPLPEIGYITFELNPSLGEYVSVLNTAPPFTFNNDIPVGIQYPQGYSAGFTLDGTTPTKASAVPNHYETIISTLLLPSVSIPMNYNSNVTVTAFTYNYGQPSSPTTNAIFHFVTATPQFIGQNAAAFAISCVSTSSVLVYTLDGSDPRTSPTAVTTPFNPTNQQVQFKLAYNSFTLTCFARRTVDATHHYADSALATNYYSAANFTPNAITFGVTNGNPQSHFLARPGQFYYAPVTLQMIPNFGKMYSLQFNVTVTNGYTNLITGKSIPPIVNGTGISFFPMLMSQVPTPYGEYFPANDINAYLPIPPVIVQGGLTMTNLVSTMFVNTNINLLGIGWLFHANTFNEYYDPITLNPTLWFDAAQDDLISYSIAHDTLFKQNGNVIVVGAYSFQIPTNTVIGDQYFIQLGSPSATTDGVGAPGSDIYIQSPALSQAVTISTPSYLVGDVAPFRWLNAGDFGDTNLDNADVMQIYECGVLGLDLPPTNSDLYAALDSAGRFGVFDASHGYYTNSGPESAAQLSAMWYGNDQTINSNAFGDGVLDINDLYVTFRRSLDPSLTWFRRYWTNGMFVAVTNANYAFNSNTPHLLLSKTSPKSLAANSGQPAYLSSSVTFTAGDAITGAGGTVQIPITANVLGTYPLRVLGLNLTVRPLDGSPVVTNQVTFFPSAALGTPSISSSKAPGNFAGTWLNAGITGLSNNAVIGTLNVTLPGNATSSSAYIVHFDFASGSPNGLAVFPNQKVSGVLTTTPRTTSSFNDGIPDSWRLRWFGTVNNVLSASNACPSGDGIPNWKKYVAGVDPNVAGDFPSVNPLTPAPAGATTAIHWPSVYGKNYVITCSSSLFGSPWTVLSTNIGTGGDMEFNDTNTAGAKFYRVEILP